MKAGDEKEELLVGYLLGDLSEEEMIGVEERLFTNDKYYERLLAVEDDLRYDYLQGRLSKRERLAFEKRFLPFAEDRRKLDFASALLTKTAEIAEAKRTGAELREKKTFWQSIIAAFSQRRLALAIASVMVLVALIASIWLVFEMARIRGRVERLQAEQGELQRQADSERARADALKNELERERNLRTDVEKELAEIQERPSREPERGLPAIFSFLLAPGRTRAEGATPANIILPQSAERLELRLSLKTDADYRSFRVALLNADGKEVWNRSGLRSRAARSGKTITVSLPARLLAEDDYELKLSGETAAETESVATYYFTLLRQK